MRHYMKYSIHAHSTKPLFHCHSAQRHNCWSILKQHINATQISSRNSQNRQRDKWNYSMPGKICIITLFASVVQPQCEAQKCANCVLPKLYCFAPEPGGVQNVNIFTSTCCCEKSPDSMWHCTLHMINAQEDGWWKMHTGYCTQFGESF